MCCGSDPVWAGQIQLWSLVTCGVGQRQVLGIFLLGSTPEHGLPPIFNVPGFYYLPLGCLVSVNALGSCWALETGKAHIVKSSSYRTLGLLHELVL